MTVPRKDRVTYRRLHMRRQERYGPASAFLCEGCCGSRAKDWATLHPQSVHESGETLWHDFVPLCRGCHVRYDQTPESRAKAAAANRGRVRTPEQRRRISQGRRRAMEAAR